ncbi:DALR anticodon-binding domain-containing protein [Nocardiopsis sp. JB363]|uniref:DALR anticodon-binding domain-containing protein n=1 Tax=Nocardiopsis sp. JB363 TaxID=1434837 RepID=UPI00097A7247|nr:DALR anticodon-binding domain-containing protein [Nocardiopsis sp. JB363]SIO88309.1 Arginyl-tRNA synthetase [Nocardiopsis sp. JB363]
MTPRALEAVVRRAALRAFDLDDADIPFVWPRAGQAAGSADASVALPPRLVGRVRDRLPEGRDDAHLLMVAGRIVAQVGSMSDLSDDGCAEAGFAEVLGDERGFVNITFTCRQRESLLKSAADGPRFLTGRSWTGSGEWPRTDLHEAGPVAQARRFARGDARARIAMAVGAEEPPPGPTGETSWRDRYLDTARSDLYTPAGRTLGRIGEDSARVAFCRSVPDRPRENETTGRDLPVLPSAEHPGAWVRLTDANPAFRLRYAHAHASTSLRWAHDTGLAAAECGHGENTKVRALLFDGPGVLDTAARREEPHILVRYLEALTSAYDEWRTGSTVGAGGDEPTRAALDPALPAAVAGVLHTGLFLLGVSAPTRL